MVTKLESFMKHTHTHNQFQPLLHTLYKNELTMDHRSKLMMKCMSSNELFLETITSSQTQFIK